MSQFFFLYFCEICGACLPGLSFYFPYMWENNILTQLQDLDGHFSTCHFFSDIKDFTQGHAKCF
jgi:hypothetical protein